MISKTVLVLAMVTLSIGMLPAQNAAVCTLPQATVAERNQNHAEVTTEQLKTILKNGSATLLDARPALEFSISHIPGAVNVAAKRGVPISTYVSDVAEVGRIVKSKAAPVIVYCNGPFCGKSKRLAEELAAAGYSNVRRYQGGIPVWRALGEPAQIEDSGARHVYNKDKTAVWIDVRSPDQFAAGTLESAKNIPSSSLGQGKDEGEIKKAKDDGRLPMNDHNTRIVVFGHDGAQARQVATAIAQEAFHNVSFYPGSFQALSSALTPKLAAQAAHQE
jgi:rhodanese-related sulfurtransferase